MNPTEVIEDVLDSYMVEDFVEADWSEHCAKALVSKLAEAGYVIVEKERKR